jgi:hypothetical protein
LKPTYKNITGIILLITLAFFSWLMLKIVLVYSSLQMDAGFLLLKQSYIHIDRWRIAFFIHVFTSMLVLIAGFTQFSKKLLQKRPRLHRTFGYIYVINVLLITGPAALIMSFYANGGIVARIAFVLLSVLWLSFTSIALYKAIKRDFIAHKNFMIRSYALTLSAISLRSWKVIIATFTTIRPMDRYRLIAWLGWVLNLLIAEVIILQQVKRRMAKQQEL